MEKGGPNASEPTQIATKAGRTLSETPSGKPPGAMSAVVGPVRAHVHRVSAAGHAPESPQAWNIVEQRFVRQAQGVELDPAGVPAIARVAADLDCLETVAAPVRDGRRRFSGKRAAAHGWKGR